MTPKIAKNMSGIDARVPFPKILQAPSKGKFSPPKPGLAEGESSEADVVP